MKCPLCSAECYEDDMFCTECGSPLLVMDDRMKALTAFLVSREIISSAQELEKCVEINFDYRSDDGIIPMQPIKPIRCPLYYTEHDVLQALVREQRIWTASFHFLPDFYGVCSQFTPDGKRKEPEEMRPEECGKPILAEVLSEMKNNTLTLIYGHRAEMLSRAEPGMCLYGCPVSSEIEKRYEGITQTAEIIDIDG